MIDLTLGQFVKWINPVTGGWETGNKALYGDRYNNEVLFDDAPGLVLKHDDIGILVVKTYGGLCIVPLSCLTPVQNRSEYERVPTSQPKAYQL